MDKDRSTINSTIKGKAYEYASIIALVEIVKPIRPISVVENSSLIIARDRYLNDISEDERSNMLASALIYRYISTINKHFFTLYIL